MHRPWLAPIVIIFWCLTTSWLVVAKILPSLLPGSPPGYQALYASNNRLIPVAWTVLWKEQPIGWAVSNSEPGRQMERSPSKQPLHFDRLPIEELAARPGLKPLMGRALDAPRTVSTSRPAAPCRSTRKGQLRAFRSDRRPPRAAVDKVVLDGTVDDGHVKI